MSIFRPLRGATPPGVSSGRTRFRSRRPGGARVLAFGLALAGLAAPAPAEFTAVAVPVATPTPSVRPVAPAQLDAAIARVMTRAEFAWRMPRDAGPPPDAKKTWLGRLMDDITDQVKRVVRWCARMLEELRDWLMRRSLRERPSGTVNAGRIDALRRTGWALLAVLVAAGILFGLRAWRRRAGAAPEVAAQPTPARPDVEDERVLASQLPEEEWIALAAEYRRAGEWRKALRAWFLATLACLARLGLVEIRASKSNREYRRDLERRTRGRAALTPLFDDDVARFERGWYGRHPVGEEALDAVARNLADLRAGAPDAPPAGEARP